MLANFILGIICLLLVLFNKDKEKGLKWVFFIATVFLAIRYDWGNDYRAYLSSFIDYNSLGFQIFDVDATRDVRLHGEYGWVILNRVFGVLGFGFFGFVIVLTAFESWILYRTIKKYVTPQYYWVSILFWVFSTSFCTNSSMMRQYLCICLFLIVIDLMIQKNNKYYLLWSIIIILIGATFHRSFTLTLFSLPLFYLKIKPGRTFTKWIVIIGGVFIIWSQFGHNIIEPLMLNFLEENDDFSAYMFYVGQEKGGGLASGLGVIFKYILFVIWLLILPRIDKDKQSIVTLLIVSYFFEVVIDLVPMAGRLALYFSAVNLIGWTYILSNARKWPWLYLVFAGQLLVLIREFTSFFINPVWIEKCYYYHTIFSAGSWM